MKHTLLLSILLALSNMSIAAHAQESEETPYYENNDQVPYPNNTGSLGTGDNSVDITNSADSETVGALKGEITLKQRDEIVEVFSNGNLVEQLVNGIGTTGAIRDSSTGAIRFEPTGRPELVCPAQTHSGWFGPCTIRPSEGGDRTPN
jgi:hypothetical protein